MTTIPYGAWPSPIQPADLATAGRRLAELRVLDDGLAWVEGRPDEALALLGELPEKHRENPWILALTQSSPSGQH